MSSDSPRVALCLLLAMGIGLRSAQLLGKVDLWHDELAIARNVEDRGLVDLLSRPLDHEQVAPVGFLALLEINTDLFGVTETALRFGPWLLSLAALFLFWRVAGRFAGGWGLCAALALFAASPALVWYGSSVKPYGADVAASLLLVWLALRHLEQPADLKRGVVAGILGGTALLFSFPAVPTAAILGALLVFAGWRRRPRTGFGPLAALGAGWALGAALAAWTALRLLDPATGAFMREFWAKDFPPAGPVLAALAWLPARSYQVFAHFLVFFPPADPVLVFIVALPLLLALVGLVASLKQRRLTAALLVAPLAAAWAAALAHRLPFDQRLGLHSAWPALVLAAVGLCALPSPGGRRWPARGMAVVMALPLVAIVLLAARPPYRPEGKVRPRDVLTELSRRQRPADRIYVYTQGRHDIAFYGRRAGLREWVQGGRHYDDPRGYLREVDALRGNPRVWFFWVRLDRDEPAWIRKYLATIGRELERIPEDDSEETGAVLYDLSDGKKLATATAESFPLAPAAP